MTMSILCSNTGDIRFLGQFNSANFCLPLGNSCLYLNPVRIKLSCIINQAFDSSNVLSSHSLILFISISLVLDATYFGCWWCFPFRFLFACERSMQSFCIKYLRQWDLIALKWALQLKRGQVEHFLTSSYLCIYKPLVSRATKLKSITHSKGQSFTVLVFRIGYWKCRYICYSAVCNQYNVQLLFR